MCIVFLPFIQSYKIESRCFWLATKWPNSYYKPFFIGNSMMLCWLIAVICNDTNLQRYFMREKNLPDRVMESLKGLQFLLSHTSDWSVRSAFFHRLFFRELQMPWSYGRTHTVKKIGRFYGKVHGNQLLVHIPLFLRASACRTFLEIKQW